MGLQALHEHATHAAPLLLGCPLSELVLGRHIRCLLAVSLPIVYSCLPTAFSDDSDVTLNAPREEVKVHHAPGLASLGVPAYSGAVCC